MSTLWQVEVRELAGTHCVLDLEAVHPDAGPLRENAIFALRLLFEPAQEFDARFNDVAVGPLGDAATSKQIHSESWMQAHAGRFVAAASARRDPGAPEAVRYTIEVTDPRWLDHLAPGQRWRSAAFA